MSLRTPDGRRMFWQTQRPTLAEREAAKANLRPYEVCGGEAYCPCCATHYLIPSVYIAIEKHGVCGYCLPFADGRDAGVLVQRSPTLAEVMLVQPDNLRQAEVRVLHAAFLAADKERKTDG